MGNFGELREACHTKNDEAVLAFLEQSDHRSTDPGALTLYVKETMGYVPVHLWYADRYFQFVDLCAEAQTDRPLLGYTRVGHELVLTYESVVDARLTLEIALEPIQHQFLKFAVYPLIYCKAPYKEEAGPVISEIENYFALAHKIRKNLFLIQTGKGSDVNLCALEQERLDLSNFFVRLRSLLWYDSKLYSLCKDLGRTPFQQVSSISAELHKSRRKRLGIEVVRDRLHKNIYTMKPEGIEESLLYKHHTVK